MFEFKKKKIDLLQLAAIQEARARTQRHSVFILLRDSVQSTESLYCSHKCERQSFRMSFDTTVQLQT
ncbi:hypothetical protein T265_00501 [Opisthorchis viverrini]|uniref:Uncharacterized protein n=1 Tax=Opisthorchis viverrini TaxID=6198 RepID=A0A075A5M7_OPIVI|nr:hypothetical protein T265_00501 [Opisthorchis viverrini]KER33607.1 hypothetical protein T265_00501 [Opisthorchis viverrini]